MEKKNYWIIFVVAILFLIIGGVGTYFVMSISKDKEPVVDNKQEENTNNSNSNLEYTDWMDYILKSDIKSIKVNYCDYIDGELSEDKTIQINKNDLNRIFEKVRKGTIIKKYGGGFGSPCNDGIVITYENNSNEYELEMIQNHLIGNDVQDKMILSLVEQSKYEVSKDFEYDENDYTYIYNYDMDIIDTIIDEYTN